MTLEQTRAHTESLLKSAGEIKIPTIEEYTPILHQELQKIASNSYVLGLQTESEDFRVLREIDIGQYIKLPEQPQAGNSDIDIDKELVYAASNMVASVLSRNPLNKQMFERSAMDMIQAYDFKVYETLKLRETEDCP